MMYLIYFLSLYTASADSSIVIDSITYLYGNVEFIHDSIQIIAKRGVVLKDRVNAYDSVRILKGDVRIETNFGEYFWNKDIRLHNGFTAYKKEETFLGKEGKYFDDKLWVDGEFKYINNKEKWILCGEKGFYDFKLCSATITMNPKFESLKDSIEIVGDTIRIFNDTLTQVLHNAVVKLTETQCFAETLLYFPKEEKVLLYGAPCIISCTDTLRGKEMEIVLTEKKIEHIIVKGGVLGKKWKLSEQKD